MSFFFGGILPVIAFTIIEEKYGTIAGVIAGMVFGVGEIIYEWITTRKVSAITYIGNGLILVLGAVSLFSNEGIWFKLQPALLEGVFTVILVGSWIIRKPFLVLMAKKQNPNIPEFALNKMSGMTLRLGFFFLIHTILATWAAYKWSTEAWAILKGAGLTVSFFAYLGLEILMMRRMALKSRDQFTNARPQPQDPAESLSQNHNKEIQS